MRIARLAKNVIGKGGVPAWRVTVTLAKRHDQKGIFNAVCGYPAQVFLHHRRKAGRSSRQAVRELHRWSVHGLQRALRDLFDHLQNAAAIAVGLGQVRVMNVWQQ